MNKKQDISYVDQQQHLHVCT